MAIYRFKVYWEENSDVERAILIKPNQTFLDFYKTITETFDINIQDVSASFFTSDDYWDKHKEITLKQEDILQDELLMASTKISSLIEHPKQKFVFVYDSRLQLTFHIELMKIETDNAEETVPKVVYSKGKIPNRRKTLKIAKTDTPSISAENANISDDELDKLIYANLMNKEISEEDILNGNLEKILGGKKDEMNEEDESDESDFFEEQDDMFDDDEFDNDGYFDEDENYEN